LRQQLQTADAVTVARDDEKEQSASDEQQRERPIDLATRAGPLIQILERAVKQDAPVMWDKS
jgi:hypothetical protein